MPYVTGNPLFRGKGIVTIIDVLLEGRFTFKTYLCKEGGELKSDFRGISFMDVPIASL